MVDDGHGREGHPLTGMVFEKIFDSDGNVLTRIGGHEEGSISRAGEIGSRQAEAAEVAPSDDDVSEQEYTVQNDPDYPLVIEEMRRRSEGFNDEMVNKVSYNHKVFNAAYAATKESMYEIQGNDHGRQGELARLREQLREHRAETGGRSTGLDAHLVARIADITVRGL